VLSGIKEIKAVMADAERNRRMGRRTLIFIDEIHRFNKAQQDAFLPYVERGDISLIGATTENPSFEVISALLSRTKVYMLKPLSEDEILTLLRRALPVLKIGASEDLLRQIATYANGDGRSAYNILELAAAASLTRDGELTREAIEDTLQRKTLLYDKSGEEHFNLISALHKSVRSSDVDAALYWLGRMLESGEDRMYIARRLVRMAIEDIGLADPRALEQSIAASRPFTFWESRKAIWRWPNGDLSFGGSQVRRFLSGAEPGDGSGGAAGRRAGAVSFAKRANRSHEAVGLWGRVPACP
jgi:putative ATPase